MDARAATTTCTTSTIIGTAGAAPPIVPRTARARTAIARRRGALRKTTHRIPIRVTPRRTALRGLLQRTLAEPVSVHRREGLHRITIMITTTNRAAHRVVLLPSIRAAHRIAHLAPTSMQGRAAQANGISMQGRAAQANEISIQPRDIAPLSLRRAATAVRRTVRGPRKRAALRLEQPLPLKGAAPRTTLQGRMVPLQLHNHEAGLPAKAKP